MPKFRRRPEIVEAVQWRKNGDHDVSHNRDLYESWSYQFGCEWCKVPLEDHGDADTLNGLRKVCPGDWLVMKGRQVVEVFRPKDFAMVYEPYKGPGEEGGHD
jgi:hypothetical protein